MWSLWTACSKLSCCAPPPARWAAAAGAAGAPVTSPRPPARVPSPMPPVRALSPIPDRTDVSASMASCFRGRGAPAPADAPRGADCSLAVPDRERPDWLLPPPCRSSIAATSCPFRIRPAPGMPNVCAMRCSSGTSSEDRPASARRRDLDAVPPELAAGSDAGGPMGEPSDAGAASLRSSVVSLTNGPSIMILGRLGVVSTRFRGPSGTGPICVARDIRRFPRLPPHLATCMRVVSSTQRGDVKRVALRPR